MRSSYSLNSDTSSEDDQWFGGVYKLKAFSKLQRFFGRKVIKEFIVAREVRPDVQLSALDIGCGDGKLTNELQKSLQCDVDGIDKSVSMLEQAAHWQKRNAHLTFFHQDIGDANLTLPKQYPLIVSLFCIHWVLNQEQVYANIAKSLADDGRGYLLISSQRNVVIPNKKSYIAIIQELITTAPFSDYFASFNIQRANLNKDNFPTYINNAGLKLVELVEINEAYVYQDKIELSKFFQGIVLGYLKVKDGVSLSNEDKLARTSELCNALVERLLAQDSYKQLANGGLESQQALLLAIIQKPHTNPALISPDILLKALEASTATHEAELHQTRLSH